MTQRRYPRGGSKSPEEWAGPTQRRARLPWRLRRLRRRVFYLCVRALVALVRGLPRAVAVTGLRALAALAHRLRPRERARARVQLARALPDRSPAELERIGRESLDRLARNLVDMVRQDVTVEVDVEAGERLERIARHRPVLVLTAHHGAWELIAPVLAERLPPLAALTADPHNEWVDRWLRRERRARGLEVFDRDRGLRAALRWARGGGTLAVLADHRTRGAQVLVPWFGVPAPTSPGPARLARAAKATILPVGIRRSGAGHRLEVGESFEPTGDLEVDLRRCNAALEELILRNPEEWTWIHDRYGELEC